MEVAVRYLNAVYFELESCPVFPDLETVIKFNGTRVPNSTSNSIEFFDRFCSWDVFDREDEWVMRWTEDVIETISEAKVCSMDMLERLMQVASASWVLENDYGERNLLRISIPRTKRKQVDDELKKI